jgi:aryl-alcohol dehydrogenase-like predicted oxidoreductase
MAQELGLGVTPWSPLRGGALSGKYTRENAGQIKAGRGDRVTAFLNERTYAIVDELVRIGRELSASPATVALAWVRSRPGVASTIIGARTLEQLEQNLAAADLTLTGEHLAALGRVSAPVLNFPAGFLTMANSIMHGGATVNNEPSEVLPLWKDAGSKRY